jgi:hypothetical protein
LVALTLKLESEDQIWVNVPFASLNATSPLAKDKVSAANLVGIRFEFVRGMINPLLDEGRVVVHKTQVVPADGSCSELSLCNWNSHGRRCKVFLFFVGRYALDPIVLAFLGAKNNPGIPIYRTRAPIS